MERIIRVLLIDDEEIKVHQISQKLELKDPPFTKNGNTYKIEVYNCELKSDLNDIVNFIITNEIECAVIDYKLNSKSNVSYSGLELANEIKCQKNEFPIFILTSLEDDIYNNETYDSYAIFDYVRVQQENNEFNEFVKKIIEQVLITERKISRWKEELVRLLPLKKQNVFIDSKILEIDNKLEKALGGNQNALPDNIKQELLQDDLHEKLDLLLSKVDLILNEE